MFLAVTLFYKSVRNQCAVCNLLLKQMSTFNVEELLVLQL